MLKEAKRLYDLGFAILWLRPNSKLPIEKNWTTGPRKDWAYTNETFTKDLKLNMGVRLGEPSRLKCGNYLAVIDCDVKSTDKRHLKELSEKLKELITIEAPTVLSGRGNGSKHIYFKTAQPVKPYRYSQSKEKIKVEMPSTKPSKYEIENLTAEELEKGIRFRAAWEISIMGTGQQVVLPPSVHPDTRRPYKWGHSFLTKDDCPLLVLPERVEKSVDSVDKTVIADFEPVPVDLVCSKLSDRIVDMVLTGKGVEDRSAALLSVAMAMLGIGFTDQEIVSVLTDPENFLGPAAYDHAKTQSRKRAAEWIFKYTLKKAKSNLSAARDFEAVVEIEEKILPEPEAEKQSEDLNAMKNWRALLEKNQQEKPKSSLFNIKLILSNITSPKVIGRDEFRAEDVWLMNTPWGSLSGSVVSDIDLVRVKDFLAHHYQFEPSSDKIDDTLQKMADENRFHPVRTFLDGLKWDGVARLDTWLRDYMNGVAPEPYLSLISRKTIVAMIKRIYEPGCAYHQVLIMEGAQGVGKSSAARILSEPWFSDSHLNIGDKDGVMNMQGTWIYELGELSAMSRADTNQLKEFISRATDRIRLPYGRRVIHLPRQCIFIGTTNNDEYLKDRTGNRRFWPVKVGQCDFEGLTAVRDQLLAEAVVAYQLGEPLWLDNEGAAKQAVEEQSDRLEYDSLVNVLAEFFAKGANENFNVNEFSTSELIEWGPNSMALKNDRPGQMRISNCLRYLGFEKDRRKIGTQRAWVWVKK